MLYRIFLITGYEISWIFTAWWSCCASSTQYTFCSTFCYFRCPKYGQHMKRLVLIILYCQRRFRLVRYYLILKDLSHCKLNYTINICTVLMKHIPLFSSNCINGFHLFNTCYYGGTLSHSVPPILCSISSMVIQKIHYSYHDIFFGKWTDRKSLSDKQYYDFPKRHITLNFEAKNIPYKNFACTFEDW